jgi:uncharacterized cupredoxin-like copper-binding protein
LAALVWSDSARGDAGHKHAPRFGRPGDPTKVNRTIEVRMTDAMRFEPAEIRVRTGEHVRFKIANAGIHKHEFVLGTIRELREHAEAMKKNPDMEHEDDHQLMLAGGKSGELVWQFTLGGTFHFGCLLPGHFDQGMVGRIVVSG